MRGLVLGTPVIPVTFSRKVSGGSGRLVRGRPQAGTQGQVASWGGVPGEPGRWEGAGLVHSLGRKKPTRGAAAERPLGGSHTPSAPGPPGTGPKKQRCGGCPGVDWQSREGTRGSERTGMEKNVKKNMSVYV